MIVGASTDSLHQAGSVFKIHSKSNYAGMANAMPEERERERERERAAGEFVLAFSDATILFEAAEGVSRRY